MIKNFLISTLFCIIIYPIFSQEVPPIEVFSTEDYGAENQNWSITQGTNNHIYIANNKGLLNYDGERWQLFPTPNETIMRSVYFFNEKVYSGFYMDFGYWIEDKFGQLKFTSLVKQHDLSMLEDEQIWEITELDNWILFKSLHRIYLYDTIQKKFKIIESENDLIKIARVDQYVYFHEFNKGIFKIENGERKLVTNHSLLNNAKVVNIFKKDNKLFFLTQKKGFFYLDKDKLVEWNFSAKKELLNKTVYSSKRLKNESFAIGTISNGLFFLDKNGDLDYTISQSLGLSNNTVLNIFDDKSNNLWLGLDNGINVINLSSPFKLYIKKNNFWGTIYTSIIHNNNIYLGTNQGLYFRNKNSNEDFKLIKNTEGQVWNLQIIDNNLFCSHNSGTFLIEENKAQLIQNKVGSWGVEKIDENLLIQGSYDGLYVLQKTKNKWLLKNKIRGFSNSSRYFLLFKDDKIFVNHEYKGIFKLTIDNSYKKVLNVEKLNIEKGLHSSLINYKDDLLYAYKKGVFKYDLNSNIFKRDSLFSLLIPENQFLSGKLMYDDSEDKLWSFTNQDIRFLSPGKLSQNPNIEMIPIKGSLHKGASGYENIINLSGKKYLIGTTNGYLIIDLNKIEKPKEFSVKINKVLNYELDGKKNHVELSNNGRFESEENNLNFFYSVQNYDKTSSICYQHKLIGFNENWSEKSENSSFLFENLSPGKYSFLVKAFVNNNPSENLATYSFEIYNPWYLTVYFKIIYVLAFILFLISLHFISRRYYKKQREKLLDKKQRELELKELESSKEIIKLNNDKLRIDIENKNRELATSTMSIIKKNEFLNIIKKELNTSGKSNVEKVIRIIDKNLNNTDDWKMFQEAFNNADKNFIKKIKAKHSELTPNDLRLCAYLRLNLSSKEIAPLLNISPRSVEVKRYRLRKKMNLDHNENLTNYIINI